MKKIFGFFLISVMVLTSCAKDPLACVSNGASVKGKVTHNYKAKRVDRTPQRSSAVF